MAKPKTPTERRKARVRRAIAAHSGDRRGSACSARRSRSTPRSSTIGKAGRSRPPPRSRRRFAKSIKTGANVEAAQRIGKELAERAKKAGVSKVVFDRGAYMYHGRVKALAEGAREGGLEF